MMSPTRLSLRFAGVLGISSVLVACGGGNDESHVQGAGASSAAGTNGTPLMLGGNNSTGYGGAGTSGGAASGEVVTSLPDGFVKTDIGGFQLGDEIVGGGGTPGAGGAVSGNCGNILLGVVRDFKGADEKGGHPDFNADIAGNDVTPNLVDSDLGDDQKPVYASHCEIGNPEPAPTCPFKAQTTSKDNFDQWYRDTPDVNRSYLVSLYLAPQPGGLFTFQSLHYFPVDGAGYKSSARANDDKMHNFGFTTELHTQFLYQGGETFTFQGDDDVWVFVNHKLAVDLGGLHPMQLRKIELDKAVDMLGIEKGQIYPLDLFHAERHTNASTFRIDTNLSFVDCGTVIPGKPPK